MSNLPKALVTGGVHGLGHALVQQLLSQGYQVHVIDYDADGLKKLRDTASGQVVIHQLDLSNIASLKDEMPNLIKEGPFDIVVLNAGISATGKFEKIPVEAHQKVLAVNLAAPMIIASGLAKSGMSPISNLVFISSLSYAVGYPGAASYAASKDALAIYAKSITKPFKKTGIVVTCVFPGPVRTGHAEKYSPKGSNGKNRIAPKKLANCILEAAKAKKRSFYPGPMAKISHMIGWIAPGFITAKMRKMIFEKLDREVF
ncbi:MAG: SDR family oxidoreductase [Rhizobiaceae bacterium]